MKRSRAAYRRLRILRRTHPNYRPLPFPTPRASGRAGYANSRALGSNPFVVAVENVTMSRLRRLRASERVLPGIFYGAPTHRARSHYTPDVCVASLFVSLSLSSRRLCPAARYSHTGDDYRYYPCRDTTQTARGCTPTCRFLDVRPSVRSAGRRIRKPRLKPRD